MSDQQVLQVMSVRDNEVQNINFNLKIKFISTILETILIVTEINEVYLKGTLGYYKFENEFTKINLNISTIKFMGINFFYSILIDENNYLYCCGMDYGQFGVELEEYDFSSEMKYNDYPEFKKFIKIKEDIKFITCGEDIVFIVTKDNDILVGGETRILNGKRENVIGYNKIENIPQVEIKDLKCSTHHCILLDYDGNIYGSGKNNFGQLGTNNYNMVLQNFTNLKAPFKVKQILCPDGGTLLLSDENEIYGCGFRNLGFYFNGFTKINVNIPNYDSIKLCFSFTNVTAIRVDNDFYYKKSLMLFSDKKEYKLLNNIRDKKWKYYFLTLLDDCDILIIKSNHKINRRNKKKREIPVNFYKKQTEQSPFYDINVLL
ncbi:hypothetical protein ABK040_009226 [Willaertia magna]